MENPKIRTPRSTYEGTANPLDFKEKSIKSMRIKRKFQKLKTFNLAEEEKKLLGSTDDDLKNNIKGLIEKKIEENLDKIKELNILKDKATDELEKKKIKNLKKSIQNKLAKNRKALTDEKEIKFRVNMLKQKRRKLKTIDNSVKENLEKLKKLNTRCFRCRRKGHTVIECTFDENKETIENNDEEKEEEKKIIEKTQVTVNKNICYNCGATDHNVHGCSKPVDYKDLPFSQCFVCKEMGHLSSKCPKSDKGIYIKGGACFECGLKDHLAKNCPSKQLDIQNQIDNNKKVKDVKKEKTGGKSDKTSEKKSLIKNIKGKTSDKKENKPEKNDENKKNKKNKKINIESNVIEED